MVLDMCKCTFQRKNLRLHSISAFPLFSVLKKITVDQLGYVDI